MWTWSCDRALYLAATVATSTKRVWSQNSTTTKLTAKNSQSGVRNRGERAAELGAVKLFSVGRSEASGPELNAATSAELQQPDGETQRFCN